MRVAEIDARAYTILGATEFVDYAGTAAGGGICYQDSPVKLVGDRGWTYVELIFKTTPRTRRIAVEPALSFGGKSKGVVYWDDVGLERLERPPIIMGWLGPRFVCDMGAGNGRLVVNRGISADAPSDPINVHGVAGALEFTADTAGTLTVEVDMYGDRDFKTYDTVSVGAEETAHYIATIRAVLMRLRYSADATATAKVYLCPRW